MPSIEIDQPTYEKLMITAQLTERTIGAVVKQLVDRLAAMPATSSASRSTAALSDTVELHTNAQASWVPVFKVYKGNRVEGEFNPSTMEVKVTTSPWSGRVFSSPTAAAIAVVDHYPSTRETSNTNGRKFWRLVATGRDLRSLVGER